MPQLKPPSPGESFDLDVTAKGAQLKLGEHTYTVDLTGDLRFEISKAPGKNPAEAVRAAVPRFHLTGTPNSARGMAAQALPGRITLDKKDTEVNPDNLISLTSGFPPKLEQVLYLDLDVTIENPPQQAQVRAAQGEPLVLTTKNPGKLVGQMDAFPPDGAMYKLQNPIDLVLPDDPDTTIATIQKFPVKVGGL
ncbi:hypothetical protein MMF93_26210 [Streptomyces tubbatahanensis]|uniref:Lipoprotein n=1 Tax=Streptomyces tubbatahanensis TaxID=2923272 RepID=A0ABY3XZ64_9ACTN|nr:hypothetical protein [Streptomyces tubbatahanensis]UNS99553.1 hypothetical protein MMF93_26210 [Streptomyces tubbatahanensis]